MKLLFNIEEEIDDVQFAQRLWGDIYYNNDNGTFHRKSQGINSKRTFVHFILEPLYKLYSQVMIIFFKKKNVQKMMNIINLIDLILIFHSHFFIRLLVKIKLN